MGFEIAMTHMLGNYAIGVAELFGDGTLPRSDGVDEARRRRQSSPPAIELDYSNSKPQRSID